MKYLTPTGKPIQITKNKIKRIVPLAEVRESSYFWDLADIAVIFHHDIVELEDQDTWRWKPNLLMGWLNDYAPVYTPSIGEEVAEGRHPYTMHSKKFRASIELNSLVGDLHNGMFTMEEWMKFYMQIGYSLSGYCEVFGQHEASEYSDFLPGTRPTPPNHDPDEYFETVLEYMRRVHEGKVLKI